MQRLFFVGVAIFAIACAPVTQTSVPDAPLGSPAMIPQQDAQSPAVLGQLAGDYPSIAALARAATHIVVGRATASSSTVFGGIPFTEVTLAVEEALKGPAMTTMKVLETGGLLPAKPKEPGLATEPPRMTSFEGVPVMSNGERYLLFLRQYEGPIVSDAFVTLGVYQGKFNLNAGNRVEFQGRPEDLDRPLFRAQGEAQGRPLAELIQEIRQAR